MPRAGKRVPYKGVRYTGVLFRTALAFGSEEYRSLYQRVRYIEITSWLMSAYDFYSRVVENHKRTSESSSE